MKKAGFYTLGCRVNQYETQALKEIFAKNGYEICSFDEYCDIYVVNSCTVTAMGDKKSRQALGRAKKTNPGCITVLAGCYAQKLSYEEGKKLKADILLGNDAKETVIDMVNKIEESKFIYNVNDLKDCKYSPLSVKTFDDKTRAMVKIEDGCDRFCSYCIIPYVRGPVRCRDFSEIIKETKSLAEKGFKEIVITGIQTAAYKWGDKTLKDVITAVAETEGIERIRTGSLEPVIITDDFLKELKDCGKFCPTFHLSLQSGSDSVLKRMNRRYTTSIYAEKIEKIREYFPFSAITTDVIAGFPGESDEEHRQTLAFAEKTGFAHMHVFPYSGREGTKAYNMEGQIEKSVKEKRSEELNILSKKMRKEFIKKNTGQTYPVLFERATKDGKYEGLTPNYITVIAESEENLVGKIKNITLNGREM